MDLKRFRFACSDAYLLNPRSVGKIADLLAGDVLNQPFDLRLRDLAHLGAIRAFTFFPYLVSPTAAALSSQIRDISQGDDAIVWNLFSRMMWLDRNLDDIDRSRERLDLSNLTQPQRAKLNELFALVDAGR